jgi:hypothetical protein
MEYPSWQPFDELNKFQSRINDLFDKTFGRSPIASTTATSWWHPAVDILESKDSYLIPC